MIKRMKLHLSTSNCIKFLALSTMCTIVTAIWLTADNTEMLETILKVYIRKKKS